MPADLALVDSLDRRRLALLTMPMPARVGHGDISMSRSSLTPPPDADADPVPDPDPDPVPDPDPDPDPDPVPVPVPVPDADADSDPACSTGSRNSSSTAPPVGRTPKTRAGMTLVSLAMSTQPSGSTSSSSANDRSLSRGGWPGPTTSSREASREALGAWAICAGGKSNQ